MTRLGFALAMGAAVAAGVGCRADGERPGIVVLPQMHRSVPYDTFEANPVSGAVNLSPPEGSVPSEGGAFPYGPGPEEAERAGRELTNPVEATPAALARGQRVYERTCIVCHGPRGEGDGPVIGRFPNPPSLLAQHARELPDGRIVHVISRGQGIMPAHALQVLPDDRWRVMLYVRHLQADASATTEPDAAAEAPREARGETGGTR